jgi:hypothetical protein
VPARFIVIATVCGSRRRAMKSAKAVHGVAIVGDGRLGPSR